MPSVPTNIKSSQRTLGIFELFAELRRPARVNELQRRLDLPQSSLSKLLRSLSRQGYLQYDGENRTFYPTLRVTLLGSWLHDQWFGHDSLLATMESLRSILGTSVLLGVQNDTSVLYMVALQAHWQPRPPLSMGTVRPVLRAAVGKALMMGKSEYDTGLLIRRINAEEQDPAKLVKTADFLEEMAESRARGYTMSNGGVVPGTNVIAMPLPRLAGQPAMALGIGAPMEWMDENLELAVNTLRSSIATLETDRNTHVAPIYSACA